MTPIGSFLIATLFISMTHVLSQSYRISDVTNRYRNSYNPILRYPRRPMIASSGPLIDWTQWRNPREEDPETEQQELFPALVMQSGELERYLRGDSLMKLSKPFEQPPPLRFGPRAAMLKDRPGRSCSGNVQCRRKVDTSLNLLMKMMETGR